MQRVDGGRRVAVATSKGSSRKERKKTMKENAVVSKLHINRYSWFPVKTSTEPKVKYQLTSPKTQGIIH